MSKKLEEVINRPKELEDILNQQIKTALREYKRPTVGLFLSAFAAGLEVGFSFFLMCAMYTLFVGQVSASSLHLIMAVSYPIGFIFVVIGRSELFTEHTTLAILPVLAGSATIQSLLILWFTIYVGNLCGGFLFSSMMIAVGPALGIANKEAFLHIAQEFTHYDWLVTMLSAMIAGWLMGLLAWLVTAANDTLSRIFIIILITSVIGIGGLHHSIVGSIEVFTGLMTNTEITWQDYGRVQLWATVGNLIGGVFFVALIKYGHIRSVS